MQPTARRNLVTARIDPRDDLPGERIGDRTSRSRIFDEHRAQHDRLSTGIEADARIRERANPTARLHRHVDRSADRAKRVHVLPRSKCSIEVDDVQRTRPRSDERTRARDRIIIVGTLAIWIAPFLTHAATAAQIECGIERDRTAHRAIARKLSSMIPPVRWLFSG